MDSMLSIALRQFLNGPLKQLIVNLGGQDGELWEQEFKKFLRKEPCWTNRGLRQPTAAQKRVDPSEFFRSPMGPDVSDDFLRFVANRTVRSRETQAVAVDVRILEHEVNDADIERELGEQCIFTDESQICATLTEKLRRQPGGREGELDAKNVNICCLSHCVVYVAYGLFSARGLSWKVHARQRGEGKLPAGAQLLSPATCT